MSDAVLKHLFSRRFGVAPNVPEGLCDLESLVSMAKRGSCRSFSDAPVDPDLLETLCAAALCAPSKSDLQQRDILLITDPELLQELKTLLGAQAWIADVPGVVIFLANNRRQRQIQEWYNQPFPNDHLDAFFNASVDAGIALAFFVVAAEACGLGCCPISTIRNHLPEVRALLKLPDHVFPVAGLGLGHPAQEPAISARLSLGTTVHVNQFSDASEQEIAHYDIRRLNGADAMGWSEAKAKMYANMQRADFGNFIRKIGFKLD